MAYLRFSLISDIVMPKPKSRQISVMTRTTQSPRLGAAYHRRVRTDLRLGRLREAQRRIRPLVADRWSHDFDRHRMRGSSLRPDGRLRPRPGNRRCTHTTVVMRPRARLASRLDLGVDARGLNDHAQAQLRRNPRTLREHHLVDGLLHKDPKYSSGSLYFLCVSPAKYYFLEWAMPYRTSDLCRVKAVR
jgi:hypothetical protein